MMEQTSEDSAVLNRLGKLENQNRRMKLAGAVALFFIASLVLMGQSPANRTVEANEFILKDENGKIRGIWSNVAASGPIFTLLDSTGKRRVTLNVLDVLGPGLTLTDAGGRERVRLLATVAGPGLNLTDANGKDRVYLFADDTEASAELGFFDEKGNVPARLSVAPGSAHLILFPQGDGPNDRVIYLGAGPEIGPNLIVKDKEGFSTTIGAANLTLPRTGKTRKTSAASVILYDKDKNVLWQAP